MENSFSEIIKKLAIGAFNSGAPTSVLFGVVTSINPLEITVEQKLKLTKEFLVLTRNVKDYTVEVDIQCTTNNKFLDIEHSHTITGDNIDNINVESTSINMTHNHNISGKKTITIYNALKAYDNVILLQQQGGNNYIVIDKF